MTSTRHLTACAAGPRRARVRPRAQRGPDRGRARGRARPLRRAAPSRPRRRRPRGALAPRLQNLGSHTFLVTHQQPAGAAVHEPGAEPRLRVQPRRSAPRVPRGRAPGSEPGDGLLGAGAGAGPEHQRGDGAQRGAPGLRAGAAGAEAADARIGSGARLHRRPGPTLFRQGRRSAAARRGLRHRDAAAAPEVSGRSRRRDAVRGIGDGSAAVGLLAA